MKTLAVLFLLALCGCAASKVNVDMDSCAERGKIDGIRVGVCSPVKIVK